MEQDLASSKMEFQEQEKRIKILISENQELKRQVKELNQKLSLESSQ